MRTRYSENYGLPVGSIYLKKLNRKKAKSISFCCKKIITGISNYIDGFSRLGFQGELQCREIPKGAKGDLVETMKGLI